MNNDETVERIGAQAEAAAGFAAEAIEVAHAAQRLNDVVAADPHLAGLQDFVLLHALIVFVGLRLRSMAERDGVSEGEVAKALQEMVARFAAAAGLPAVVIME
jgi:hypothetical protein